MKKLDTFYINGTWTQPKGTKTFDVVNPATEQVIASLAMGEVADVNDAVAAARGAFDAWSNTTAKERQRLIRVLLDQYEAGAEELAELMTAEMGVAISFSRSAQVELGRAHLKTAIDILENYKVDERRGATTITREPIGVCALITPWNWPMNQVVAKVAAALATGCTMVVKPSEYSALSAFRLAQMVHDAGFPPGVFNLVSGDGVVVGEALSRHPGVDMVSITGSTRAGAAVARAAADTIKRVHQELGGKSANIIFPDDNFERNVAAGVMGCYTNCGQSCAAPTRMLVPLDKMEEAAQIAARTADALKVGDPMDAKTDLGPVVNARQYAHITGLIKSGIEQGAKLVAGGEDRPSGLDRGYYVRPTVFANVTPEMRIAKEEIFGPVLCIIAYRDEEDAIRIANDSIYGLAGYVHASDPEQARRVALRLRVGNVYLNQAQYDVTQPFGGYKQSGNGRENGAFGLHDYLEIKAMAGYPELAS